MSTPTETVQEFMAAFIAAWPQRDAAPLAALFGEDAVYHNGPLEPVKGREAILSTLAGMMAMGGTIGVHMIHMVADGEVVMTERIDYVFQTDKTMSLPVMGIFEIHDGVITAWRDYFDPNQFTSQMPDES